MTGSSAKVPTLEDLRQQREQIIELAEQYGASRIRVFGSVARGDTASANDIDLLVTFEEWASLYDMSGLKQSLEDLLGCKVDVVSDHPYMKERIKQRIMQDVINL